MRIGCLHTAASNVAVLERAATSFEGVSLRHIVRPDLLAAAGRAGLTSAIAAETRFALDELAVDCDAVLLTCSSLGGVVDDVAASAVPMLRVDRALAERAVADGGRVIVLCAAPSSVEPTGILFRQAAQATGAAIDMRLVPHAWTDFLAGDLALSCPHCRGGGGTGRGGDGGAGAGFDGRRSCPIRARPDQPGHRTGRGGGCRAALIGFITRFDWARP